MPALKMPAESTPRPVDPAPARARMRLGYLAAAAAMIMLAGVAAMTLMRPVAAPNEPASSPPVAVMFEATEAVWASEPHLSGDELAPQAMVLSAGRVKIAMHDGTNLSVEGPAQWTLHSASRIDLRRGRVTAESSVGFTVVTPRFTVVDQGTEFGVLVDEDGTGQVQVFAGSVLVSYANQMTVLAAGEAGAIGTTGDWHILPKGSPLPFAVGPAPDEVLADARADYRPVFDTGFTTRNPDHPAGLPATRRGMWNYYSSATLKPSDLQLMTYGPGGDADNPIYRGQVLAGPYDLPAIAGGAIFSGPVDNPPGPRELAVHGSKTGPRQFAVVRWTAGSDESGVIRIAGHARQLGTESISDGMDLAIFVDGRRVFDAVVNHDNRRLVGFDLEQTIRGGQHVDFVFGCRATFNNDQTGLRAEITWLSGPDDQAARKPLHVKESSHDVAE
jgi:hypothetical protein